jgi:hypothetical protein
MSDSASCAPQDSYRWTLFDNTELVIVLFFPKLLRIQKYYQYFDYMANFFGNYINPLYPVILRTIGYKVAAFHLCKMLILVGFFAPFLKNLFCRYRPHFSDNVFLFF